MGYESLFPATAGSLMLLIACPRVCVKTNQTHQPKQSLVNLKALLEEKRLSQHLWDSNFACKMICECARYQSIATNCTNKRIFQKLNATELRFINKSYESIQNFQNATYQIADSILKALGSNNCLGIRRIVNLVVK